jgi:carbonic anhydrase/acetyltransferase-like protein (isoleucine patch superfamily)
MPIYALGDLSPTIHPTAWISPDAVLIGNVVVGAEATIWPTAVLRADNSEIRVGARTSIQDGTVIHCTFELPTIIGEDCVIGHNTHLEGCIVEDACLVGSGSVVLNGVRLETGSLVAAGAVVSPGTVVPSRASARGVPARMRPDSVDPERDILPGAVHYVEEGRRYRAGLRLIG